MLEACRCHGAKNKIKIKNVIFIDLQFTIFSYKLVTLGCHLLIVVEFESYADRDLGVTSGCCSIKEWPQLFQSKENMITIPSVAALVSKFFQVLSLLSLPRNYLQ